MTWGPVCAEPALRAWGEQVAGRIRQAGARAAVPDSGSRPHQSDGDKGVAINRLTRRLRISDPPHHFQTVATTVLRTSLNLTAVAWVPQRPARAGRGQRRDSAVERRRPIAVFPRRRGTIRRFSALTRRQRRPEARPPSVRRYASVAAGSLGWLLAVNPLDDREITTADIERLQHVGSLIVAQLSNAKIYADLKELLFGIIRALTAAIDAKDPYTSGHSERVARIAVRLAEELRMPARETERPLSRRAVARRGQDRHRRRRSQEDRPADARGVPEDPGARGDRRDDPQGPAQAAPHSARRKASSREHGRHRLSGPALPGKKSRSRPASWRWPTRSTRCRAIGPIGAGSACRRSTIFCARAGAFSGTPT